MTPDRTPSDHQQLFSGLCDGALTPAQHEQLDELLRASAAARSAYRRFMQLEANLWRLYQTGWSVLDSDSLHHAQLGLAAMDREGVGSAGSEEPVTVQSMHDAMILPAIASTLSVDVEPEAMVPLARIARRPVKEALSQSFLQRHRRGLMGMAAGLLLVLALTIYLVNRTTIPSYARMDGGIDVHWGQGAAPDASDHSLPALPLYLQTGVVELTLSGGAKVMVEAPCQFTVDSPSHISLASGKLSAVVREQARGFTVVTHSAQIIDLGTEFAIQSEGKSTQVHVFKGVVVASPVLESTKSETLKAGNAAEVVDHDFTPLPGGASPQLFVRELHTTLRTLDMIDLFAGGDGSTQLRSKAIEVDGKWTLPANHDGGMGDHAYHPIPTVPVLDGIFVPDEKGLKTQVDSAKHTFGFPATSNQWFAQVIAGGPVPMASKYVPMVTKLGAIDYAQAPHGLLFTSGNRGVTLNLNTIRKLHPGSELKGFRCVVGNTNRTAATEGWQPKSDAYVIVDGVARFQRDKFTPADGAIPIEIAITPTDHFLTLAVTDGGDGISCDGVIWGDPIFMIEQK